MATGTIQPGAAGYIESVSVTTDPVAINPGSAKESTGDITIPTGYGFLAAIPQYTNSGMPIVSAWITLNPNKVHATVRNVGSTALSAETATVRVLLRRTS